MLNKYIINKPTGKSVLLNLIRNKTQKHPLEKLPRDPKKLTSNQPPLSPNAIYSEDEKLKLWKSLGHFNLKPTYPEYSAEEQEKLQVGHLKSIEILGVTKPKEKPNEIDPTEEPYCKIYEGIDDKENSFTKVRNLTETEPQRWYWVQRLMPKQIIPRTAFETEKLYPSGIKIPSKIPDLPYFVARTRNHLLPVYKLFEKEDERVKTVIQKIDGDIWELEQEIRTRLEAKHQKRILTAVNEVKGELKFLGNYVFDVVDYLEELGF